VLALLLARRDEELDAKLAGEILDRWDELVEKERLLTQGQRERLLTEPVEGGGGACA
jgi:hypothetical protein